MVWDRRSEVRSWIRLILNAELWPTEPMTSLHDEVQQLRNIVGKSIVRAKGSQQKPNQLWSVDCGLWSVVLLPPLNFAFSNSHFNFFNSSL